MSQNDFDNTTNKHLLTSKGIFLEMIALLREAEALGQDKKALRDAIRAAARLKALELQEIETTPDCAGGRGGQES